MTNTTIPTSPPRVEGVSAGTILLILAAFGIAGLGLLFLSQATAGVGAIAIGCLLGICARIAQAGAHHKAAMQFWMQSRR